MKQFTTGKVAKACNVSVDTIRYYEKLHLISNVGRTSGGYRLFDQNAVKTIHFIKNAQNLGFSLDEIGELLLLSVNPTTECSDVKKLAGAKLLLVNHKIDELVRIKEALVKMSRLCPGGTKQVEECGIIEALYKKQG